MTESASSSRLQSIVGWLMLLVGISVFAIRLQHAGPYALPEGGNLLGGVLASALSLRAPYYIAALGFALTLAVTWSTISNKTLVEAQSGPTV